MNRCKCGVYVQASATRCPDCGAVVSTPGEEYELRGDADRLYDAEHDAKIVDWRTLCFMRAGLSQAVATALAVRRDIERQTVEAMAAAGASSLQVAAILL